MALFTPLNSFALTELHAHLFMKHGLTWWFHGEFNGPLAASSWKDRFSSQANPETMDQSGLRIVVASLYALPVIAGDLRESIRAQIQEARRFVKEHPNWVIATRASDAKREYDSGKNILILSLEGTSGIIENERDMVEFIDQGGIRIVNLLHLIDDEWGGVAFLHGIKALTTPWAWFQSLIHPQEREGARINPNGLTPSGLAMAAELMKRKVWIDLAHASDHSAEQLIDRYETNHLPLLFTHTSLRKYLKAERGIAEWQITKVKTQDGMIGLMPCEDMLIGVPSLRCNDGFWSWIQQFNELADSLGSESVTLGTDYNGGINRLKKTCAPAMDSFDEKGFWNIGQATRIWNEFQKNGAKIRDNSSMDDKFLRLWARVNN